MISLTRRVAGLLFILSLPAIAEPPATTALPQDALSGYRLVEPGHALPGVKDDLSGITYCGASDTFFAVLNGTPLLLEISRDGRQVKRQITLDGFEDTEDVAWLEGPRFAVVEERRRNLCFFDIAPDTTAVAYTNATRLPVDAGMVDNMGLEGVTLDPESACFYLVKEKQPRKIYAVRLESGDPPKVAVSTPWDLENARLGMSDVSAICWNAERQCLFLLSDESKCVVQCTTDGHEIARLKLRAGQAGLDADIPQPEGITFGPDGRLIVVSEPNLIYMFEMPTP